MLIYLQGCYKLKQDYGCSQHNQQDGDQLKPATSFTSLPPCQIQPHAGNHTGMLFSPISAPAVLPKAEGILLETNRRQQTALIYPFFEETK